MNETLELNIKAKPSNPIELLIGSTLFNKCSMIELVGSQVICSPPPGEDSDTDILCLSFAPSSFKSKALLDGWKLDPGYGLGEDFPSFKKGKLNIILTGETEFFDSFVKAKEVCKALNLMKKEDRIKVHHIIMGTK
jgi:hypothetical protein